MDQVLAQEIFREMMKSLLQMDQDLYRRLSGKWINPLNSIFSWMLVSSFCLPRSGDLLEHRPPLLLCRWTNMRLYDMNKTGFGKLICSNVPIRSLTVFYPGPSIGLTNFWKLSRTRIKCHWTYYGYCRTNLFIVQRSDLNSPRQIVSKQTNKYLEADIIIVFKRKL